MASYIHHSKLDLDDTVQLKINLKNYISRKREKIMQKKKIKKKNTYIKTLPGIGSNKNFLIVAQQNHLPWSYHYMPIIKCNSRLKSQTINY